MNPLAGGSENDVIKFKKGVGFVEHDGKWLLIEADSSSWCVIDKSKRILGKNFLQSYVLT